MGGLLGGKLRLAPHLHPASHRRRPARLGSLSNQRAFQFRQNAHHLPHGAACRRGGVYGLGDGEESHIPRLEAIEQPDKVMQRPTEAVELPDDERVTSGKSLQALSQNSEKYFTLEKIFRKLTVRIGDSIS